MICDSITTMCQVPMGAMIMVVFLASVGVSITFWGVAEDIQKWWNERHKD